MTNLLEYRDDEGNVVLVNTDHITAVEITRDQRWRAEINLSNLETVALVDDYHGRLRARVLGGEPAGEQWEAERCPNCRQVIDECDLSGCAQRQQPGWRLDLAREQYRQATFYSRAVAEAEQPAAYVCGACGASIVRGERCTCGRGWFVREQADEVPPPVSYPPHTHVYGPGQCGVCGVQGVAGYKILDEPIRSKELETDRMLVILPCGHWVQTRRPDDTTYFCFTHGQQPPARSEDGFAVLDSWTIWGEPETARDPQLPELPLPKPGEVRLKLAETIAGEPGRRLVVWDHTVALIPGVPYELPFSVPGPVEAISYRVTAELHATVPALPAEPLDKVWVHVQTFGEGEGTVRSVYADEGTCRRDAAAVNAAYRADNPGVKANRWDVDWFGLSWGEPEPAETQPKG